MYTLMHISLSLSLCSFAWDVQHNATINIHAAQESWQKTRKQANPSISLSHTWQLTIPSLFSLTLTFASFITRERERERKKSWPPATSATNCALLCLSCSLHTPGIFLDTPSAMGTE